MAPHPRRRTDPRPPHPVLVRAAVDGDARAVADLLAAAHLAPAFDPPQFLVAESDGEVVACARLRPLGADHAELASVAVVQALRGRGIGERMVRTILAHGPPVVYALALAPGFFERLGFERLSKVPEPLNQRAAAACQEALFVPMVRRA